MAGLFRRLFGRKKKRHEDSAENVRIQKRQQELAKQIGHIPGIKIPGISPAEAERLREEAIRAKRSRRNLPPSGREPRISFEKQQRMQQGWTKWYTLTSSNVDRIRYHDGLQKCQAVFKPHGRYPSRLYEYSGVEPFIFLKWTTTHSPGQYQWNVIRAYGYPYTLLATGLPTGPKAEDIHANTPFAVPKDVEEFQRSRGRASVDVVPTAEGFEPPPFWRQFRR